MGTTVTTNLGLIKPDTAESIREDLPTFPGWADQNADNCDTIDALFRASYGSYSLLWTGSGGNPTLGAGGFLEGEYLRLHPRKVAGWFRMFMGGAGFAAGTGTYNLSLPVAVDTSFTTFQDTVPIGKAALYDDSAVLTSDVFTVVYHVASNLIQLRTPAGVVWTPTTPITLAQQDRISGWFTYPTAAA